MDQKPTIGRIVHYGACSNDALIDDDVVVPVAVAALILAVNADGTVVLRIFTVREPESDYIVDDAPFAATLTYEHWTWPPRV